MSYMCYDTHPGTYGWKLKDDIEPEDCDLSGVRLISIRLSIDPDDEHGSTRHMMSCVFDDGIFSTGPISPDLTNAV